MNGAESLVHTLIDGGVEVCFANPGTSEMHFVAALDRVPGLRCVLGLFEGVVTGAADGYARMTDAPAATLLHLGPGLANGLANLHNAKRARTPVLNVVGDHAVPHRPLDAPLTSDVEAVARTFSDWVRLSPDSRRIAFDGAAAIAAARSYPGRVATLILPADTAWGEADGPAPVPALDAPEPIDPDAVRAAAEALRSGEPTLLLIGGRALRARGLDLAGRIAAATGCSLLAPQANARIERGAGRVAVDRVAYAVDMALDQLKGFRRAIVVEAREPVGFFAYPGKPGRQLPEGCGVIPLAGIGQDGTAALEGLAEEVGARAAQPERTTLARRRTPASGPLDPETLALLIAARLPEGAIVIDEAISAGRGFFPATAACPPHDWLQLTGGAIGGGVPLAVGAAIACPGRKVVALQADGSAMYTLQGLWTQAREGLDVVTVILSNRAYAILKQEIAGVGANPGRTALDMLELDNPALDWPSLARGMGVPGERVLDAAGFAAAFERGLASEGPCLIEAVL